MIRGMLRTTLLRATLLATLLTLAALGGAVSGGCLPAPAETSLATDGAVPDGPLAPEAGADSASPDARPDAASPDATPTSLRVLFVGNSYTFTNDLPGEVVKLATSAAVNPLIQVSSVTAGGATLKNHWDSSGAVAEIGKATWDVVVLQGQSVEPLYDPTSFATHAQLLAAKVKQAGAAPLFFETWARQAGNDVYSYAWSGGTPKAMQAGLRQAYAAAASAAGAQVAPVGDAWEATLAAYPQMPIFAADGSHPSVHGTYLSACVFYAALAGKSPKGLGYRPAALSQAEADALQQLAHDAVK